MISADLQPSDSPPFYSLVAVGQPSQFTDVKDEDDSWAVAWRASVRLKEGRPVPLPTPPSKQYYSSLRLLLKLPARQLAPLHRYLHIPALYVHCTLSGFMTVANTHPQVQLCSDCIV